MIVQFHPTATATKPHDDRESAQGLAGGGARAGLRGLGFAEGEAALAPKRDEAEDAPGPPVDEHEAEPEDAATESDAAQGDLAPEAGPSGGAPVQMRAAVQRRPGQLTGAQVSAAVAYNRGRGLSRARWRAIQRQVGAGVDGLVGPNTVRAVARWQASHGLGPDGKVGPRTLARLGGGAPKRPSGGGGGAHALLSASASAAAVRYNQRRGFSPAAVRLIQEKVGASADGIFGPNTVAKIAAWQKNRGLAVDGKVGPATSRAFGVKPGGGGGAAQGGSNSQKLAYAKNRARAIGLYITSTTGGKHTKGSYHYRGRAIDVAGSGAKMAQFYREMHTMRPTELFYDPLGGVKYGRDIGAIGGHGDHVHVAF